MPFKKRVYSLLHLTSRGRRERGTQREVKLGYLLFPAGLYIKLGYFERSLRGQSNPEALLQTKLAQLTADWQNLRQMCELLWAFSSETCRALRLLLHELIILVNPQDIQQKGLGCPHALVSSARSVLLTSPTRNCQEPFRHVQAACSEVCF